MAPILKFAFPALMIVGLLLSALVIVSALQAQSTATDSALAPQKTVANSNLVAQGRALFLAKGCIVCHRHDRFSNERAEFRDFYLDNAPNLARLQADPAYIAKWLANPQAVKPNTEMPNLNLSASEIDALVAFLTQK